MADNINITAGAGTTIATDQVDTYHYQKIKLVDGTADSATIIAVDIGVKANALRICPANDITDAAYIGDIKFGEALPAGSNAIGKLAANSGVDIGDVDILSIAAGDNNIGNVDIVTVPAPLNVVGGGTEAAALRVTLANDSTGVITVDGTVTANLSATDNAVLDAMVVDLAALEVDLAAIEILQTTIAGDTTSIDGKITACNTGAVVLSSGTVTTVSTVTNLSQLGGQAISMGEGVIAAGCQRVTLATDDDAVAHLATIAGDTTAIETAVQIIDDWDAVHDSAASTDGPQIMGAYDSTKPTAVGDGDAVRLLADSYGRLLTGVEPQRFQAVYDSADATAEAEVVHASAASTVIVVQSFVISSDVEGWIKLQDEDSTALTGKFWLKAGGGVAITLPDNAPIILGTDKDLEVIAEAAGNVSVTVTGYTIPG